MPIPSAVLAYDSGAGDSGPPRQPLGRQFLPLVLNVFRAKALQTASNCPAKAPVSIHTGLARGRQTFSDRV